MIFDIFRVAKRLLIHVKTNYHFVCYYILLYLQTAIVNSPTLPVWGSALAWTSAKQNTLLWQKVKSQSKIKTLWIFRKFGRPLAHERVGC